MLVINCPNQGTANKPWALKSTFRVSQTNSLYITINVLVIPVVPNLSTTKDILLSLPSLPPTEKILRIVKSM
jgi:hypothetical protein